MDYFLMKDVPTRNREVDQVPVQFFRYQSLVVHQLTHLLTHSPVMRGGSEMMNRFIRRTTSRWMWSSPRNN